MKRREFVKNVGLASATGLLVGCSTDTDTPSSSAETQSTGAQTAKPQAAATQSQEPPAYAGSLQTSDGTIIDADGNAQPGFAHTSSESQQADPKAPYQMPLIQEEQDIMDGKKGPELAKVMKIVVGHGNAFGAPKLVELGGAPHCSLYTGTDYMKPMIDLFQECADAGLKTYAPYTVNPRCYDVYNVNNNETDMELIYEGYKFQRDLDWVHAQLGAPDLNYRSCACYVPEVGNAPPPGTYVAWAESSAINYGNSALGLRTNRNAAGMELLCGILGKAPLFGLMTDEGRMANWLVDVKTSEEPDLGVLGTAIGLKVIDGVPFITGMDQYLGTEVSNDNMHLLKKMGSATAASGAVGLYHVENLTPDAKEKGRGLLKDGYQTYVYDDAEQARVLGNFPVEWEGRPKDPTVALIGCPHNTYEELLEWGTKVTEAVEKRGMPTAAIPTKLFCSFVVRDHLVEEHPVLVGKMTAANMRFTNMCTVSYAGMKGFSDRIYGVTNSPKTRNYYPSVRYLKDDALLEVILTGNIPSDA
jgi:predicted aconitase